ncbi:hypothetical protein VQ03_12245 [Methylobacterium tarhaniae]|uniref:Uncharacterized protein n=2 Tax=Methylobacterium tarhaniae TaxID=1187852 RepID=A0A0J6T2S8_9HYPH|nr:hypothetical protein VQ03_12245 [Methylobacterium tarhaniae]
MMPVVNSTDLLHLRRAPMPRGGVRPPAARRSAGTVEDGYRYRAIGSALALLVAVAASLLVTALLRVAL